MTYKYRVFCETEAVHVETGFQASEPTVCPNDAGHTLREYPVSGGGTSPKPVIVDTQE